jgi:hypothetical protein
MDAKFNNSDLLTYEEIKKIMFETEPTETAKIITKKINKYIFCVLDFTFQYRENTVSYDEIGKMKDEMLGTYISLLITQSKNNLKPEAREKLKDKSKDAFNSLAQDKTINKYLKHVKSFLIETEYKFSDPQLNKIHFKNGYYDMKENLFKKRVKGEDFINFYIDRDYKPAKPETIEKINNYLKKIYYVDDDRNYLLMTLAIAFTGQSTKNQKILYLIGTGSSGKTTIINFCKSAFSNYVFEMNRTTFSASTPENQKNKILNEFLINRNIRLSNINEPEDTRQDETLFKDFCDGIIKTTSLFRDGQNTIKHYSKLIYTANTMLKIKKDSGVICRTDSYRHTSKFTDNKTK